MAKTQYNHFFFGIGELNANAVFTHFESIHIQIKGDGEYDTFVFCDSTEDSILDPFPEPYNPNGAVRYNVHCTSNNAQKCNIFGNVLKY